MISIVMMSYLGNYHMSRSNPVPKFNMAVQSVVEQTYKDWELIIVSDGCELTNTEYASNWSHDPRIKLIKTEKSKSNWPGAKRQIGINEASGEWVTYLDSDDIFLKDRLSNAVHAISKSQSDVIFDNAKDIAFDITKITPNTVRPEFHFTEGNILIEVNESINLPFIGEDIYYYRRQTKNPAGTWCIFHKKHINARWADSHKTGEDNDFIKRLKNSHKCESLTIGGYIIRHFAVPGCDI